MLTQKNDSGDPCAKNVRVVGGPNFETESNRGESRTDRQRNGILGPIPPTRVDSALNLQEALVMT